MTSGPQGQHPSDSEVPLETLTPPWWLRQSEGLRGSTPERKDRPRPAAGPERPGPARRAIPEAAGDGAAAAHALTARVREAIRGRRVLPPLSQGDPIGQNSPSSRVPVRCDRD